MKWKILLAVVVLSLACGVAQAAPEVKRNKNAFTVTEAVNDETLAAIKAEMKDVDPKKLGFALTKIKDEDLAKLCAAYPDMDGLTITGSKELTSIAPVAKLKGLRGFKLGESKVTDLTPLAGLTEMQILDVDSRGIAGDFKWMSGMTKLTKISVTGGKNLTSFEGIPSLPNLKDAKFSRAAPADLTPLLALSGLKWLHLTYCTIQDLTPLTKLEKLEELSLYASEVKDFSPLADCPKLQKVTYYAVKNADYATLGTLTQLKELNGGLTDLADISWVSNLPNLKKFDVFSEKVTDYSPLGKVSVEDFQIWSMKVPVDLTSLGAATSLTKLKLWDLKDVSNFEGLGSLVNLKKLIIDDVNKKDGTVNLAFANTLKNLGEISLSKSTFQNTNGLEGLAQLKKIECREVNMGDGSPFDLAFLAKMPALRDLSLSTGNFSNFNAIAGCTDLNSVSILKANGITSLAALKKLPGLRTVNVTKGAFPESELTGFGEKVKVNQR